MTLAVTRRSLLAGTLATAAVPGLAACTGFSSTDGGAADGTLTVGFDNEPLTLDPAFSASISSDRNLLNLFYDTLLRQRDDGTFEPALARYWQVGDRSVTFVLRKGLKFHDGTALDAASVVSSLERIMNSASKSPKAGALSSVASVKADDARTVTLTLRQDDPLLLVNLAHEPGMIVSPTALQEHGGAFGRNPVGSGPFVFQEWRAGDRLTGTRNDAYWDISAEGAELPRLDAVTFRFITEASAARAELASGGIQLVRALPPKEYAQLPGGSVVVKENGVRRAYYVSLNVTRPPFDDPDIRSAFAQAVDRKVIGNTAAKNSFDLAPTFAAASDWFYDESLAAPSFDPEEARRKVTEASAGRGVAVTLLTRRRAPDPAIAEVLRGQLEKAGFTVKVETLGLQRMIERLTRQDFDAGILVIDIPRLDPSLTFNPYFTSAGPNNWSGVKDARLDGLLERAVSTGDTRERKRLYVQVQKRLLEKNYWVFLHQARSPLIHSATLKGVVLNTDGQVRLERAYLA
ncbi:ABC transporter substrate-binding protein [Streptomyces sp. NPDC001046]|uniref:ABC transporter substrate-binding protein n=1 Tax=Streptomyces sp. NPDC001046 TaxID=3364543 RepID=UPI003681508A